jgi:Fe-S cluster assembly scaffold protein SufB
MITSITVVTKDYEGNAIMNVKYDRFMPSEPLPAEWGTMTPNDKYDWLNERGYWVSGETEDMVWEDCPTEEPSTVDSLGETQEHTILCR